MRPEFIVSRENSLDPDARPPLSGRPPTNSGRQSVAYAAESGSSSGDAASSLPSSIYHDPNGTRWQQVVSASVVVRTKFARETAQKLMSQVLRAHADVAVGELLALYPWASLADVVGLLYFHAATFDARHVQCGISFGSGLW